MSFLFDPGGSGQSYSPEQIYRAASRYSNLSQYTPYGSLVYDPEYRSFTMQMSPLEREMYQMRQGLGGSALSNAMAWFGGSRPPSSMMDQVNPYPYQAWDEVPAPGGDPANPWKPRDPNQVLTSESGYGTGDQQYYGGYGNLASAIADGGGYQSMQARYRPGGVPLPDGGGAPPSGGAPPPSGGLPYRPGPDARYTPGTPGSTPPGGWNPSTAFAEGAPEIQENLWTERFPLRDPQNWVGDIDRVEKATFDRARSLLDPYYSERRTSLAQEMANRGMPETSEIYGWQSGNLGRDEAEAYQRAALGAVGAGREEHSRLSQLGLATHEQDIQDQIRRAGMINQGRQQRFSELASAMGWGGGQSPNLGSFYGPGGMNTSPFQIAQQGNMFNQQQRSQGLGGLLGLGAGLLPYAFGF